MSFALETDIAVIGAGPAGLTAALVAARGGAQVTVFDEYAEPGGQFYKQLPAEFAVADRARLDREYTKGDALLAEVTAAGVALSQETLVWGSFEPGTLAVMRRGEGGTVRARKIVVASGAIERPAVFPGWDLPGVMTPGGAQTLVKNQRCLPGHRVVLAGSGPFLLAVARTLIVAGNAPIGIYEATHPREWFGQVTRLWGHWDRIGEALDYRRTLAAAGVPVHFRRVVVRAEGRDTLERVVLAECDAAGRPIAGTEHTETADVLCAGYGFVPATQATRMLGCGHRYDTAAGGWVPVHGAEMETSVEGVFVAGEAAGIGGAYAAMAEGRLAALAALRQLGKAVADDDVKLARRERQHRRAFAALVADLFTIKDGVYDAITDDTLVCRCEEVTAGAIRAAVKPWGANVNFVKGATRCGMGYCQGRICGSVVEALVARQLALPPGSVDCFRPREPLKPLRVQDLAALADDSISGRASP